MLAPDSPSIQSPNSVPRAFSTLVSWSPSCGAPLPDAARAPFAATALTVFSSALSPRGARYTAVGSAPLSAAS